VATEAPLDAVAPAAGPPVHDPRSEAPASLRTVDELAAEAGVSVRTVRFYAGKGLLPPPQLRGRLGLYDDGHLARLRLVRDLQEAGFTLAAIQGFVARMPPDATADDVAVFAAMLTPWVAAAPEPLTRGQLDERAGRAIDDEALADLVAAGSVQIDDDGRVLARPADLALGLELLDLGVPRAMLAASQELIGTATGRLAEDLAELLRQHLLRPYLHGELGPEQRAALSGVIERLKPLTIQAVMTAMQSSVDRAVRERVGRSSGPMSD
jgi:DNA-binding transcriptional MerR regulator